MIIAASLAVHACASTGLLSVEPTFLAQAPSAAGNPGVADSGASFPAFSTSTNTSFNASSSVPLSASQTFRFDKDSYKKKKIKRKQDDESMSREEKWKKLREEKQLKVKVSGFRYIKFKFFSASGSSGEFASREGLASNSDRIEQGTSLRLAASIGKSTSLDVDLYEMPKQDRTYTLIFKKDLYKLTYGNFSASFDEGSIAPFSKNIEGVQYNYANKRYDATFTTSKSKSQTQTRTFTGRNQKGPYDLGASDLVEGSLRVTINGKLLKATEYVVDIYIGNITFNEILTPKDYVSLSFEQRLTGGLNEGAISGYSVNYKAKNNLWSAGVSHVDKAANRIAKRLTETSTDETPSIENADTTPIITVANGYVVYFDAKTSNGSEKITKTTALGSKVLAPGIDYNVNNYGSAAEYEAKTAENYYNGRFILKDPIKPGESITVTYLFYPEGVYQRFEDIQLQMDTLTTGYLSGDAHGTIYYGSESLYYCSDIRIGATSCNSSPLLRGIDYIYDKDNKKINIINLSIISDLSANVNSYLRINTSTYPDVSSLETQYNQSVDSFRMNYDFTNIGSIKLETAQSFADVSAKPISEQNYIVLVATSTPIDCSGSKSFEDKTCVLPLGAKNIVPGSLTVFLNDVLNKSAALVALRDYTPDTLDGTITLTSVIPANSVLKANYQYRIKDAGLVSGRVTVMDTSLNLKSTSTTVNLQLKKGDTFFAPIGGGETLETNRMNLAVNQNFFNKLTIGANWTTSDIAYDIYKIHNYHSKEKYMSYSINNKFLKDISFSQSSRITTDDYSPHRTKSSETGNSFSIKKKIRFLKDCNSSFSYSDSKIIDDTPYGADQNSKNKELNFDYQPSKNLMLKSKFTISSVGSVSNVESFTSINKSKDITINWDPIPMVNITGDIKNQNMSDTRPGAAQNNVSSNRISLSTKPFSRFNGLNYSLSQEDRPGSSGVSSKSKTQSYNTGVTITKSISFSPSLTLTNQSVGDSSSNSGKNTSYMTAYRRPGTKYHISHSINKGENTFTGPSGSTSKTDVGWAVAAGYDPSKVWQYDLKWKTDSSTGTKMPSSIINSLDLRINRNPRKDSKQWLLSQKASRKDDRSAENNMFLELGMETLAGKKLFVTMRYKFSTFKRSSESEETSYSGNLLEGSLKYNF